jgi:hypothetical protein
VGEPGALRITGATDDDPIRLRAPDGEEFTPAQRRLFGAILLDIDASMTAPGIYEVMSTGAEPIRRVAFNLDARESDLAVWPPDEAAERVGALSGGDARLLDVSVEDGVEGVMERLEEVRSGVELWNVFLLVALLLLVAEMLVAHQWRPEAVSA